MAFAIPTLLGIALLAKDALVVVDRINEQALAKERLSVEHGLRLLGEQQAHEIVARANGDTVHRNLVEAPDIAWMREHLGDSSEPASTATTLAVLDADGRVIFSRESRGAPSSAEAHDISAAARVAVEQVRAADAPRASAGSAAGTGSRAVTDIAMFDGRPALVTVVPVLPRHGALPETRPTVTIVGIQSLVGPALTTLQSLSHVEGLLHVPGDYTARTGRHAQAVRNLRGEAVTHLSWIFTPPGHTIFLAALPAFSLSAAILIILMLLSAIALHRLTRRLAESEQAALHAARHDTATGLANRGWFMQIFSEILTSRAHIGGAFAVLLIDCDNFKTTNDTLGHAAGDAVLRAIAARLRSLEDRLAIFSRLGGDEFAAVTRPLACAEDTAALIALLERTLSVPVPFGNHMIPVSVSIGAAMFDAPSPLTIDTWLARADMALYRAKRDGRNCTRMFDPAIDTGDIVMSAHLRVADARAEAPRPAAICERAA